MKIKELRQSFSVYTTMAALGTAVVYWGSKLFEHPIQPEVAAIVGGLLGCAFAIFKRRSVKTIQAALADYLRTSRRPKTMTASGTVRTGGVGGLLLAVLLVMEVCGLEINMEVIATLDAVLFALIGFFLRRADKDTQQMIGDAMGAMDKAIGKGRGKKSPKPKHGRPAGTPYSTR